LAARRKPARPPARKPAPKSPRSARPRRAPATDPRRHLVALDAALVMRRLRKRHGQMVEVFGQKRDRSALLDPLRSWYPTATFQDLVAFAPAEQRAVARFYEAIEELVWYLRWTEDMPGTLRLVLDAHLREVEAAYAVFDAAIAVPVRLEPEDAEDLVAEAMGSQHRRPGSQGRPATRREASEEG
jgi:hypothetical protein